MHTLWLPLHWHFKTGSHRAWTNIRSGLQRGKRWLVNTLSSQRTREPHTALSCSQDSNQEKSVKKKLLVLGMFQVSRNIILVPFSFLSLPASFCQWWMRLNLSPAFSLQKNSGMCYYPTHIWTGEAMSLPRHLYPLEKFISGGKCNQSNWYLAAKCFNSVYLVWEHLVRNHTWDDCSVLFLYSKHLKVFLCKHRCGLDSVLLTNDKVRLCDFSPYQQYH